MNEIQDDKVNEICWLKKNDMMMCCCNCRYHLQDHFHCQHTTTMDKENFVGMPRKQHLDLFSGKLVNSCECSILRGWICANPEMYPRAHSGWPEHACGCEMYLEKQHEEAP